MYFKNVFLVDICSNHVSDLLKKNKGGDKSSLLIILIGLELNFFQMISANS
jgi:hypothetical protein